MCDINLPGQPSSMENPENPANGLAPPGCKVRELTNGEQEAIVYQHLDAMVDDWQQLSKWEETFMCITCKYRKFQIKVSNCDTTVIILYV